ncbi:MAG TPA: hypothetical protein VE439_02710, partial [Anaerolineae bacterium]|nr:hypothetical protein [Anaerolineae bacterium]
IDIIYSFIDTVYEINKSAEKREAIQLEILKETKGFSDVDRKALAKTLVERGELSREEAEEVIQENI